MSNLKGVINMNALQVIEQREVMGKQFTMYGDFENPLFLAKEVANWIDYSESNVSKLVAMVEEDEKVRNIITTLGGNQEAWFLTEDGVYEVLMQSRKPIAKQFKKAVKEILKSVRKHGIYATDGTLEKMLTSPDFGIRLLSELKKERQAREEAEEKITEMTPKVIFADALPVSKTSILVGELAKVLNQNGVKIGEKRLFQWLRRNGYLIKREGTDQNIPTQKAMELKLFEIKQTPIIHSTGDVTIAKTTKVTGKGQQYFIRKFLEEKEKTKYIEG